MKLEEIEKWARKCGCSQCKEKLFLLSEIHRLRGAIEKHKNESWPKGEVLIGYDEELYKALEDL